MLKIVFWKLHFQIIGNYPHLIPITEPVRVHGSIDQLPETQAMDVLYSKYIISRGIQVNGQFR